MECLADGGDLTLDYAGALHDLDDFHDGVRGYLGAEEVDHAMLQNRLLPFLVISPKYKVPGVIDCSRISGDPMTVKQVRKVSFHFQKPTERCLIIIKRDP